MNTPETKTELPNPWQSTSNAPKDGTWALCCFDGSEAMEVREYHDGKWFKYYGDQNFGLRISHWMPLPEPPKPV